MKYACMHLLHVSRLSLEGATEIAGGGTQEGSAHLGVSVFWGYSGYISLSETLTRSLIASHWQRLKSNSEVSWHML